MKASPHFDHELISDLDSSSLPVMNLAELIFHDIDHRDEDSDIILSHEEKDPVTISLKQLRYIVHSLYLDFKDKNIKPGDTVLLASISGNNELYTALLFAALTSFGVRVLLPMYMESADLEEWIEVSGCNAIIVPGEEMFSLNRHDNEKATITGIIEIAEHKRLRCYDTFKDFYIKDLVYADVPEIDYCNETLIQEVAKNTDLETEALLLTTSGSTGKSKIVIYEQGGFIKSCLSWQQAGFFEESKFGGRGFTPLFTHTMGIRAFFNALWIGVPVCLIKTEWFVEKPEVVRYFLMQMKPAHITGGSSVYDLLFEIIRNFPELKSVLKDNLSTLMSSGTAYNLNTAAAIRSNFNTQIHNAFGTTETQQVMSTLLYHQATGDHLDSLGLPLPGVKIGLKKLEDSKDLYHLFVRSEFGMKKYLGDDESKQHPEGFFHTGDLVSIGAADSIHYAGREQMDFIKDGFGVKIPVNAIRAYYSKLHEDADHIEYFPLKDAPGLTAMLFITEESVPAGIISDTGLLKNYTGLVESLNVQLSTSLETFECRHRLINRFAVINAKAPRTVKGNPSSFRISTTYKNIIAKLTDTFTRDKFIVDVESSVENTNPFTKYHNPHIGQLMSALSIDKTFHRGKKDSLYTYINGKEIEILDMTGGYGSNLLGHSNEEIVSTASAFLKQNTVAVSDQGSLQKYAGLLAEKLNLTVGEITGSSYNVIFGSTGSEAVEIAIHHALFEWRKRIEGIKHMQYQRYGAEASGLLKEVWKANEAILANTTVHMIALKSSFHGSSSGARSILANTKKREAFKNILGVSPVFIDDRSYNWKEQIEKEVNARTLGLHEVVYLDNTYIRREISVSTIIAAIVEPVIGEGGIRIANTEAIKSLSTYDYPLIMDEIQCGLGRCGSFLASEGIDADYYLFGKSLGGNVEKISAVLIEKNRYLDEFGEYYTSTFANGGLSANVALRTLSVIHDRNIPEKAKLQGEKIMAGLKRIKGRYPDVIDEISGTGLMQGIRFCDMSNDTNTFLRILYNNEYCGLMFSSYLLNKHNVRVFPTLSAPNVLRVEPSAFITDEEINTFIASIEDLADKIDRRSLYELFLPMMDDDPFLDNKGKMPDEGFMLTPMEEPAENAVKVALIAHFVYPTEELRILEKDLCKASDTGLRILFNRLQLLLQMKPLILLQKNLFRGKIHFTFITIPVDTAELERLSKQNDRQKTVKKIQAAVDLAGEIGAEVVSLGAYTSILSNNGLALVEPDQTKIVTGNTLTAASGIRRLIEQINGNQQFQVSKVLGIIGASGNIGSIISEGLLGSGIEFEKVYLIGRNEGKLHNTLAQIDRGILQKNKAKIEIATSLSPLKECNIIVVASSTNDPIIYPHHLNSDMTLMVSDLSVPAAISKEVTTMTNVINIPFASYIQLNDDPDFILTSHTPKGAVFCCVAEAILLGLEPLNLSLKGKISRDSIQAITKVAEKYDFFNRLGALNAK